MSNENTRYPGIWRACFMIAVCNNGLRRDRPEAQIIEEYNGWMATRETPHAELQAINDWLAAFNDEELENICDGEETEVRAIMASAPPGTDDLLNRYFEKVC